METDARVQFEGAVEAARLGPIFAHNLSLYQRWRRASASPFAKPSAGLAGEGLEKHMAALHQSRPDLVMVRAS